MTREQLINAQHSSNSIVRSFSAPRPLVEALTAHANERGQSISYVVRKALVEQGIVPPDTP